MINGNQFTEIDEFEEENTIFPHFTSQYLGKTV